MNMKLSENVFGDQKDMLEKETYPFYLKKDKTFSLSIHKVPLYKDNKEYGGYTVWEYYPLQIQVIDNYLLDDIDVMHIKQSIEYNLDIMQSLVSVWDGTVKDFYFVNEKDFIIKGRTFEEQESLLCNASSINYTKFPLQALYESNDIIFFKEKYDAHIDISSIAVFFTHNGDYGNNLSDDVYWALEKIYGKGVTLYYIYRKHVNLEYYRLNSNIFITASATIYTCKI